VVGLVTGSMGTLMWLGIIVLGRLSQ
jgi:hypothetical protein